MYSQGLQHPTKWEVNMSQPMREPHRELAFVLRVSEGDSPRFGPLLGHAWRSSAQNRRAEIACGLVGFGPNLIEVGPSWSMQGQTRQFRPRFGRKRTSLADSATSRSKSIQLPSTSAHLFKTNSPNSVNFRRFQRSWAQF